ncbi:MAG: flippase-like domain-containing protein [Bacteroidetes bacterium]|nr:flippase-like domain-containing protein [Fibrella sp.]
MQSNDLRADSGAWWTKKIAFRVKLAGLAGMLTYIAYHLHQQPTSVSTVWQQLGAGTGSPGWLTGLVLLMPVNWGIEARKWQLLIRRIEPISFGEAYQGVLAGVSLGFTLPVLAGDAAGRVLSLRTSRRAGAVGASLVSGGLQFLAALLTGTVAWAYHLLTIPSRNTFTAWVLLITFSLVLLLSMLTAGLRHRLIGRANPERFPWLRNVLPYWQTAGEYTNQELSTAFGLALLRHLTFSAQFYLALRLYGIDLAAGPMISGIGVVFLAKTVTPAFTFLSDLGVREAAALWVFSPYGVSAPLLLTATFTLWLTNVLAPVLVGLLAVWRLRLTTR